MIFSWLLLSSVCSQKILLVTESKLIAQTHSKFISFLNSRHQVKHTIATQSTPLKAYGQYLYDKLILLGLSNGQSYTTSEEVLAFFDSGRDILVVGDLDLARKNRKIFFGLGLEPSQLGTEVVDFINHKQDPRTVKISHFHSSYPFLNNTHTKPLFYRGIAFRMTSYVNRQIFPLIRGKETLAVRSQTRIQLVGRAVIMLAAVQGTNNARAILAGSLDFFSDEFFDLKQGGNKAYVEDLIGWIQKSRGKLNIKSVSFGKKDSSEPINAYTVEDRGWYTIEIQEEKYGQTVPFVAEGLQLQFIMLDPYIRDNLTMISPGLYKLQFLVPSQHGIFTFKFDLGRAGYQFLIDKKRVTVRTKRHDEYPRFLPEAYPYYIALWVMGVSFITFFVRMLYHKPVLKRE